MITLQAQRSIQDVVFAPCDCYSALSASERRQSVATTGTSPSSLFVFLWLRNAAQPSHCVGLSNFARLGADKQSQESATSILEMTLP